MKVFSWLRNRFQIVEHVDVTYPSIKVAVRMGDITLAADSVDTLKDLMKLMPPINEGETQ